MICEYLPGEELTVDTICRNGDAIIVLIRTRDKINNGISQAGRFIENEEIVESVKKIVWKLKLDGPIGFQYKKSTDNRYKLLEINPRIQGTSVASLGLNINLPGIALGLQNTSDLQEIKKLSGVGFMRFYDEVFFDF